MVILEPRSEEVKEKERQKLLKDISQPEDIPINLDLLKVNWEETKPIEINELKIKFDSINIPLAKQITRIKPVKMIYDGNESIDYNELETDGYCYYKGNTYIKYTNS